MSKFDLNEIGSPAKTNSRRMAEADFPAAPPASPPAPPAQNPGGMNQSEFSSGGPTIRKQDEAKKTARLAEMLRRHQAP